MPDVAVEFSQVVTGGEQQALTSCSLEPAQQELPDVLQRGHLPEHRFQNRLVSRVDSSASLGLQVPGHPLLGGGVLLDRPPRGDRGRVVALGPPRGDAELGADLGAPPVGVGAVVRLRQEVTIAEAASAQQVDRSTIMRIKQVAQKAAVAAPAGSKTGAAGRQRDYELETAKASAFRNRCPVPARAPPAGPHPTTNPHSN
jgi:hypothetical protein